MLYTKSNNISNNIHKYKAFKHKTITNKKDTNKLLS